MTLSPTALMLSDAIEASDLTQTEISNRAGFKHPNVLTMMKQGLTRVPLQRIPALAQALGMDQSAFLLLAIEEYHSGVYEILTDVLGVPFSDAEQGLVVLFRMANLNADIELEGPLKRAFEAVLELAEAGKG